MTNDPKVLATLAQTVEGGLRRLFAYADGLPEPRRTEARNRLRALFSRAAGQAAPALTKTAVPAAPTSGPRRAEPRLVVTGPANDGSKGPKCERCGGAGVWKGDKGGSGPCFACNGSGVKRQRSRGTRYGSR